MDLSSCMLDISPEESMRDSIKSFAKKPNWTKQKNPQTLHLLACLGQLVEGSYCKRELSLLSRTNLTVSPHESMLAMTNDCSVSQVVFYSSWNNLVQNFTRDWSENDRTVNNQDVPSYSSWTLGQALPWRSNNWNLWVKLECTERIKKL